MSGPNSDQPVNLPRAEIERLLVTYRQHRRSVDGSCSCGVVGCMTGFDARTHLWAGGINPEWPDRSDRTWEA